MIQKDLRILLISPLPPPEGGIASWTKQYIEWAENNKLNVEVVNSAVIGNRAKKINDKTRILDEVKRTKLIIQDLKTKIRVFKPKIVHLNTPCGKLGIVRDFFCARIAIKNEIKLIVHYRCNVKDQVISIISKIFLRELLNISDLNLVLNSSSLQYISQRTNRDVIQIPNFINDDFLCEKQKNIREEIKVVSFIGHVQRSKGIIEIIEAAKKMPEIIFKLGGPVADEINQLDKPPNLILMGSLTKYQVKELLIESDVFLFPSYTEGFANVMLEAMATGVPIIATPAGANVDMIESMGGVIVDAGDSDSIVEAIKSIKGSMRRLKMSEWNLTKVKNEYTINKVMRKLISIYLKILNQ